MKKGFALGTIALALALGIVWGIRQRTLSTDHASISDRVGVLSNLPRGKWGNSVARLAIEIQRLPAGRDKTELVRVLADRVSERAADHTALQTIADTLVEAINASPNYERGPLFWPLARLAYYDHVKVVVDDAGYRAALVKAEAQDKKRLNADFKLFDIEGRTWGLRDLNGRVVLVNFWATWCIDCRAEMPDMEAIYKHFAPQGLVILAISDETREKVAPFIMSKRYTFPVLLDPGGDVNKLFNVVGIPQSFLYDRKGKLVAHAVEKQTRSQFLDMFKVAGLAG
ncbi:MAG TPA: TlpA disulfide reductase family protein [Bryobacteraceae bacterium]|nr:TlpA disulfide reductase family protein [Bryobacteraceae bacterium]